MAEQAKDLPPALIRASGMKVTRSRVRVLTTLLSSCRSLSHSEIEAELSKVGADAINRVTLYRILDSLEQGGLVLKSTDSRGVFQFSAIFPHRNHKKHLHFCCTNCGRVFCLKAVPPPPPKLPQGFHLDAIELTISGTCASCGSI